jgi:hypothetical protein
MPPCQLAWTDTYRPRTLQEVVGNARAKHELLAALRGGNAVLVSGPTGIGKTSLAFAACAELQLMVQTCDLISEDARETAQSLLQVQELLTRKGSEQVALVLDEVHLLSNAEKVTLARLLKKRHGKRVICICDELDRSVDGLKQVCTSVRMFASSKPGEDAHTLCTRILAKEARHMAASTLHAIVQSCAGDLRRAVTMLQLACQAQAHALRGSLGGSSDVFVDSIFHATTSFFIGAAGPPPRLTLEQRMHLFKQHDILHHMLFENYLRVNGLMEHACVFSDADVLYAHPRYQTREHASALVTHSLATHTFCCQDRVQFATSLGRVRARATYLPSLSRFSWEDSRWLRLMQPPQPTRIADAQQSTFFSWLAGTASVPAQDILSFLA